VKLVVLVIVLVVAGSVTGTLVLAGAQLIVQGQQSIAAAQAQTNAQNAQWAQYCRENGSQTPGCNGPSPYGTGLAQPLGEDGQQEVRVGQGIVHDALVPAAVSAILAIAYLWLVRRSSPRSPGPHDPDAADGR
jgi:predicted PurR-regulated permease PerM